MKYAAIVAILLPIFAVNAQHPVLSITNTLTAAGSPNPAPVPSVTPLPNLVSTTATNVVGILGSVLGAVGSLAQGDVSGAVSSVVGSVITTVGGITSGLLVTTSSLANLLGITSQLVSGLQGLVIKLECDILDNAVSPFLLGLNNQLQLAIPAVQNVVQVPASILGGAFGLMNLVLYIAYCTLSGTYYLLQSSPVLVHKLCVIISGIITAVVSPIANVLSGIQLLLSVTASPTSLLSVAVNILGQTLSSVLGTIGGNLQLGMTEYTQVLGGTVTQLTPCLQSAVNYFISQTLSNLLGLVATVALVAVGASLLSTLVGVVVGAVTSVLTLLSV